MRVLVTWGSKRGGTEGIAHMIAEQLRSEHIEVDVESAGRARPAEGHDAVIVGGALYANRWHRDARRFVLRNKDHLRRVPVWFFSSGPLDDSAEHKPIPPSKQVERLMERVGARAHVTFGGRLAADAKGFPASAMAKEHAGDWRSPEQIRGWATELARQLPNAQPGIVVVQPGRSGWYVLAYGALGWALGAGFLAGLLAVTSTGAALALRAMVLPIIFVAVSRHYFAHSGAREPLPTALSFTGIVALLDLALVAPMLDGRLEMLSSIVAMWLPLVLILLASWITGFLTSTLPWPQSEKPASVG